MNALRALICGSQCVQRAVTFTFRADTFSSLLLVLCIDVLFCLYFCVYCCALALVTPTRPLLSGINTARLISSAGVVLCLKTRQILLGSVYVPRRPDTLGTFWAKNIGRN